MNKGPFDLVVLGVGMAGLVAAQKCARAGWRVAVVDSRPYGGTCALRGCDPKKILRRGPEIVDAARALGGKGFEVGNGHVDWRDLIGHKRAFTDAMPDKIETGLERAGVARLHGIARFEEPELLRVEGESVETRHVLIATGAKPRPLQFPGADHLIDSTAFMELDSLPEHIAFLGGGYVSMEFAHMAARAGARVTVLDRGDRILKAFDPDLTERLTTRSRDAGIDFCFHENVRQISARGNDYRVETSGQIIDCNLVVHGAGRVADVDGLALDCAGVDTTPKGVRVNEYLQSTSNPTIYAAGDAADTGLPLTPVATSEGSVAASNLIKGNARTMDYAGTPSVAFTIPEIARVGMSEAELKGRNVRVVFHDTSSWYSQLRVGETHSATKVLIDDQTDQILGAHLLGHGYGEVANLFALAMQNGMTASDLKRNRFVYPSAGSDIGSML